MSEKSEYEKALQPQNKTLVERHMSERTGRGKRLGNPTRNPNWDDIYHRQAKREMLGNPTTNPSWKDMYQKTSEEVKARQHNNLVGMTYVRKQWKMEKLCSPTTKPSWSDMVME
jgi:hypothetical protein